MSGNDPRTPTLFFFGVEMIVHDAGNRVGKRWVPRHVGLKAPAQSRLTRPRIAFTAPRPFLVSTRLALADRLGLVGRLAASR